MGLLVTKEPKNVEYLPVDLTPTEPSPPVKKKKIRGRPSKKEIEKHTSQKGRMEGEAARMRELKARLLATGGTRILDTVIRIALEDGHPNQVAALKMCVDRMLPMSLFEKDAKGQKGAVTINIVGATESQIINHNKKEPYTIDMEVTDAEEEEGDEATK